MAMILRRVAVEDVSRMDVAAVVMAATRISPAGQVPIAFELQIDASRVDQVGG